MEVWRRGHHCLREGVPACLGGGGKAGCQGTCPVRRRWAWGGPASLLCCPVLGPWWSTDSSWGDRPETVLSKGVYDPGPD